MTRLPDWRERLIAFLGDASRRPFEPGRHDCMLFAAGGVEALTGVDLAADWRGRYRTLKGGLRVLRKAGYRDHEALVAQHLPEVAPAFAQAGDIAVLDGDGDGDGGLATGIVQGERIYVLRPSGLGTVLLTEARRAFRV